MIEKEIISKISNYSYNLSMLREIDEKLQSICIKTTATYGNLAPSSGGDYESKVETIGNRKHELKAKRAVYAKKVAEVVRMINQSGLDDREKGVMIWIAHNGKLQAYARREHIGKFNVYKIRDRAVRKIIAATAPHNVE